MTAQRTNWPCRLGLLVLVLMATSSSTTADDTSDALKELFQAVQKDDKDGIDAALKKGADINARSPNGQQTPLMSAVLNGKERAVAVLLDEGADVTIGEKDGYTPMHGAGFQGRAFIAKMLFSHGLDLRDKHADGFEPIHRACWGPEERHTDTVQFFLEAGVPVGEIFDECISKTRSDATKKLLTKWKETPADEL